MREIDRRTIEEYHIPGILLMENAARSAANVAWEMVQKREGAPVEIICGGGNNGGDGLAIARHLHNAGALVSIATTVAIEELRGDARANLEIVQSMKLPLRPFPGPRRLRPESFALVIDAIFGTGLSRPPESTQAAAIEAMNRSGCAILAVDIPSGMDCDSGEAMGSCVNATKTVTFVAEKLGFANPASRQYTGEIIVGDIGCPRELIARIASETP